MEAIAVGSTLQEMDDELRQEPGEPTFGAWGTSEIEQYWASREPKKVITILRAKERAYFEYAVRRGYAEMWLVMMAEYYGVSPAAFVGFDAAGVTLEGDDNELVRFRVNQLRSFVRQLVSGTTRTRPAFKATAVNTDYKSLAEVDAVEALIGYMYEQSYGETKERMLVERAELFGKSWAWLRWDPSAGEVSEQRVTLPDGTPTPMMQRGKTGGIITRILAPWDVIEDPTVVDPDDHAWRIVRERRSKWEVAASYPEHEHAIKAASARDEVAYELSFGFDELMVNDEDIIVKHFYHAPTAALPAGRYMIYVADEMILDSPLTQGGPVEERTAVPLVEYQPGELIGNSLGYSDSWDLVVLNQMLTQITSDVASNLSTYGRQSIVMDEGTEIDPEQLANGMYAFYKPQNAAPPQPINLAQIPGGAQWFLEWLERQMQVMSGLNSVARGDPAANIKSGTMAALFHSIALEYQHARQATLDKHRERTANLIVEMVRQYATVPMMASIAGQDERYHVEEFSRDTFDGIRNVVVHTINPLLRTRAGQLEVANFLKEIPGAIKTPEQAIEIITSGQLKPTYRAERSELLRIAWENEQLAKGTRVTQEPGAPGPDGMPGAPEDITPDIPVLATDNPFKHVPEHMAQLSAPEAIHNDTVRAGVLAHVQWHMRVYQTIPPTLAAILGFQPPMAPPPPPGGPPPGPGVPPPTALGAPPQGGEVRPMGQEGIPLPQAAQPPGA